MCLVVHLPSPIILNFEVKLSNMYNTSCLKLLVWGRKMLKKQIMTLTETGPVPSLPGLWKETTPRSYAWAS